MNAQGQWKQAYRTFREYLSFEWQNDTRFIRAIEEMDKLRREAALERSNAAKDRRIAELERRVAEYEHLCSRCGNTGATFAPGPYASDINNDDTPVWMCDDCRYESAQDI